MSNGMKPQESMTQTDRWETLLRFPQERSVANPGSRPPSGTRPRKANQRTVPLKIQNFCYHAPAAKNVQLVGDFTNWLERPINLRKGPNGTWWGALRLAPGAHCYRFLVDGQWHDDPECSSFVSNPFGSQDAVRQVV